MIINKYVIIIQLNRLQYKIYNIKYPRLINNLRSESFLIYNNIVSFNKLCYLMIGHTKKEYNVKIRKNNNFYQMFIILVFSVHL